MTTPSVTFNRGFLLIIGGLGNGQVFFWLLLDRHLLEAIRRSPFCSAEQNGWFLSFNGEPVMKCFSSLLTLSKVEPSIAQYSAPVRCVFAGCLWYYSDIGTEEIWLCAHWDWDWYFLLPHLLCLSLTAILHTCLSIYLGDLVSAPSRELLRGTPSPDPGRKKGLYETIHKRGQTELPTLALVWTLTSPTHPRENPKRLDLIQY